MATGPFHAGELEVQTRLAVADAAARLGRMIGRELPPQASEFLAAQSFVVLAGEDASRALWISPLLGAPGFVRALESAAVAVKIRLADGDPLRDCVSPGARVALLAIDLAERRRLRVNGAIAARADDYLEVSTREVFWNCPKYISTRDPAAGAPVADTEVRRGRELGPEQRAAIAAVDTFFIASCHAERGLDASHRGGPPGFASALDSGTLEFPDFPGNNMFQTLGNVQLDPRVGLAFPDFERGRVLQLGGRARIDFEGRRRVVVEVERWLERSFR